MATIDHLVVRAETLEQGVGHVEAALGVKMAPGGVHAGYGTHNELLSLGDSTYLEVIAPNPAEPRPKNARMFDMDKFSGNPQLSAWVLGVKNANQAMAYAPEGMGDLLALSRGEFRWLFSFPPRGCLPFAGAFPALIEWRSSHPAARLPQSGCRLHGLEIFHPQASELARALGRLLQEPRLSVAPAAQFAMRAQIMTPAGLRELR